MWRRLSLLKEIFKTYIQCGGDSPCLKKTLRLISSVEETPLLKGTVSQDFLLLVFFMYQFPPAPEYSIKSVLNFFKNLRRYFQVKVHQRYQRHRWKIYHRYQRHWRQIFPPVSLVLLIPVANLPPVSTIPAANLPLVSTLPVAICHRYQRHQQQICHGCKRHLTADI